MSNESHSILILKIQNTSHLPDLHNTALILNTSQHKLIIMIPTKVINRSLMPPMNNNNSGGPSYTSSLFISAPHLLISHIFTLLSLLDEPNIAPLKGAYSTLNTSSQWFSNEWILFFKLRKSHNLIELSPDPDIKALSSNGLVSIE